MFDLISSYLNQGLAIIVPVIILLGLLIFVHELGHFLAAKFFGVRVETFSLGFGPKIFKFQKGDTTYCISALPLGGYVKMFGDEHGKEVEKELQPVSFLHKPVSQRFVIALAGPLMNLFFAPILFYMVAQFGDKALAPVVGEIAENSVAFSDGFRNDDKILAVNGQAIDTWDDFENVVKESAGKELSVEVERDGSKNSIKVTPVEVTNKDVLSTEEKIGEIKGLNNELHLPIIGLLPNSPLAKIGLKSGDHITHVDNQEITYFRDIQKDIEKALTASQPMISIKAKRYESFVDRKSKSEDLSFELPTNGLQANNLGLFIPQTMVADVKKDSPAAKAGLQILDKIVSINGVAILSFNDIVKQVSSYKQGDAPLNILATRNGEKLSFKIEPEPTDLEGQFGVLENRYTIGIVPLKSAMRQTFTWKAKTVSQAFHHAISETLKWTTVTCLSFVRMIQGTVPAKNIGGFISIGQVAHHSWNLGLGAFFKIMAIISINLFILNLLPIPILDGGHLMLFTLEAIKGSPLSIKKVEIAQQVGFLFILFLMAFALFNDFSRIFGS